jgi:hypothetical protein
LTVALFYREHSKHSKSTNLIFKDHLLGVASIAIDDFPTCLLVWIGIIKSFPCKKPNLSWKETLENMQGSLNMGTFMICTIQLIKSILVGKWTPVCCQVFGEAANGALNFYKKSYFVPIERDHELIHLQYL